MAILDGISSVATSGDGKAAQSAEKYNEDFNQFLNLLVTQLKNQDPLDPMDSAEFTNQLVQFASVEQQIQQNANLEKLVQVQETSQLGSLVGYIDNTIEAEGKYMPVEDSVGEFTYTLDANASSVTLTIRDMGGTVVYFTDGNTQSGKHSFTWDGKDNYGMPLDDGTYNVTVSAKNAQGESMEVMQTVLGRVSGLRMDGGTSYLQMGDDLEIDFDNVIAVKDKPVALN